MPDGSQEAMRAAVYRRYGPPEVVRVERVAAPEPGPGMVRVKVRATTVCAADWRLRSARPAVIRVINGLMRPVKIPVLGMEFSGVVEKNGAGAGRFAVGEEVFGATGFRFGAHAEYVCAEEAELERRPANVELEEAAGILFGGISALCFLRRAGAAAGQRIVVHGAAGSVGTWAVQIAKAWGLRVTGVCGPSNVELVKSLGAEKVVDYTKEDFAAAGGVYDIVFDAAGHSEFGPSVKALRPGGAYVRVGVSGGMGALVGGMVQGIWAGLSGKARMVEGVAKAEPGDAELLREMIESGAARVVIERRYGLEEIVEAHRHAEAGHKRGQILVLP